MSIRTIFNPSKYLAATTRTAIKALGIDLDEYVSNIISHLNARGEFDLADKMVAEIEASLAEIGR